jgi:two-component system, cell cycle sensor histidine kinase and response regulator CckA
MDEPLRILHLEDNELDAELIQTALAKGGLRCTFRRVAGPAAFEQLLGSEQFDLAICDYHVPGFNGFAALQKVRSLQPVLPTILVSGVLDEEEAVECLKSGATDYILKGRLHRLVPAIRRALVEAETARSRKQAYESLRLNEERLRCVLMATNDAVYDCDVSTGKIWWNQCLRSLFGHNPHELSADREWWYSAVHPEDRGRVQQSLERTFAGKISAWAAEYRFLCSDGKWANVYDRGYILRDENGTPVRIVGALMDITERKKLEEEFLRSQRMEGIGTIAAGVAHDLNNMLSPILAASELLEDSLKRPEDAAILKVVKDSVMRGSDLVKQIMTFARGISGERAPVDVKLLGKELSRLLRSTFPKAIKVELNFPPRLRPALANPTHLHQVLLNLCVNARDAMPAGGRLTITASEAVLTRNPESHNELPSPALFVVVSVTDTGTGIHEQQLPKIFDPFYTTKKSGQGTGLGLATVKTIMRNHGGFVTVASEVAKGSEFRVFFPAVEQDVAVETLSRNAAPRGNRELILLVEDEVSIAELGRMALEAHNYRVLKAHDPDHAIRIAERERKDLRLVVADWQLPGRSGFQLMKELRERNHNLRTICTTGSGEPSAEQAAAVNCVLRKPYGTQDLLKAVAATLAERITATVPPR